MQTLSAARLYEDQRDELQLEPLTESLASQFWASAAAVAVALGAYAVHARRRARLGPPLAELYQPPSASG